MPPKRKSPITLKVKSLPAVSNCNGTFNFVTFVKNACERDTPYARLRRNPRTWTNAWFDHVLRTQEIFDVPHIQPTWRASSLGQIQKIPLSESALLVTGVDRPGVATSDGDESGVDVNTACAEEELSGHDLAQSGGFVIFPHFLHRPLSLLDFLPLLALPPDWESELLCENLHLSPRAKVPLAKC